MKIVFNGVVITLDGTETPLTIKQACVEALLLRYQDEPILSGDNSLMRFKIAERVQQGEGDFTAEEISLIKKLVAKNYGPLVVGRVFAVIDP